MTVIDAIVRLAVSFPDRRIVLLKNKNIVRWLFGDLSFLPVVECKNVHKRNQIEKENENAWGKQTLKTKNTTFDSKQWTSLFGEYICEELLILMGDKVSVPAKKQCYKPDLETEKYIIEVKTGTYRTSGTAAEKILGCPFKYIDVPTLWSKPLQIICIGGAEQICREQYGILGGPRTTDGKRRILDFYQQNNITYIGATSLLDRLVKE